MDKNIAKEVVEISNEIKKYKKKLLELNRTKEYCTIHINGESGTEKIYHHEVTDRALMFQIREQAKLYYNTKIKNLEQKIKKL